MILGYPLELSKIKLNFTLDIPAQLNYYFEMKGKKQMQTKKQTLDISSKWENQLPHYATIYSSLNEQGKKEMIRQLKVIGKLIDRMQKMRKEKTND
mgnify:CR=1 FL=1